MREIEGLVEQMTRGGAAALPGGEPVPELRHLRERDARRLHAEAHRRQEAGARARRGEVPVRAPERLSLLLRRARSGPLARRTRPKEPEAAGPRIRVRARRPSTSARRVQNKTLDKEFSIRNFGSADLVIENVSTTCGCTVALGYDDQGREAGRHDASARLARDADLRGQGAAQRARPLQRSRQRAPSRSRSRSWWSAGKVGTDAAASPARAVPRLRKVGARTRERARVQVAASPGLGTRRQASLVSSELAGQRRVQGVAGLRRLEVAEQRVAEQRQVADRVEDLVAHELVLEAQLVVEHAGLADHHRVLEAAAQGEAVPAQRLHLAQEAERARGGDALREGLAG